LAAAVVVVAAAAVGEVCSLTVVRWVLVHFSSEREISGWIWTWGCWHWEPPVLNSVSPKAHRLCLLRNWPHFKNWLKI